MIKFLESNGKRWTVVVPIKNVFIEQRNPNRGFFPP